MLPPYIFCPKCGMKMPLQQDNSGEAIETLLGAGYQAMGKGRCPCGVWAVLCWKALPKSPTFTLLFDIYKGGI